MDTEVLTYSRVVITNDDWKQFINDALLKLSPKLIAWFGSQDIGEQIITYLCYKEIINRQMDAFIYHEFIREEDIYIATIFTNNLIVKSK